VPAIWTLVCSCPVLIQSSLACPSLISPNGIQLLDRTRLVKNSSDLSFVEISIKIIIVTTIKSIAMVTALKIRFNC
jgi:hypothetical protein